MLRTYDAHAKYIYLTPVSRQRYAVLVVLDRRTEAPRPERTDYETTTTSSQGSIYAGYIPHIVYVSVHALSLPLLKC